LYWYPSGDFAFLPLHAAGIYNERDQVCTSDYVVSSYIPSLSSLIKARQGVTAVLRKDLKAALVAEPGPPELYIPEVKKEVQNIASLINAVNATIVNDIDSAASIGSVVRGLSEAHILHLACHGFQDRDPLQSHFLLNDGATLTISELMKLNLPNARFAFLSACETAKGDAKQPDQAVHLAASLLFCGFRSVIATMWSAASRLSIG
jgi:CHAT domain-containing protein